MITKGAIKIYGVAGSGKTTLCMKILEELFGLDTDLDDKIKTKIRESNIQDLKENEFVFTSFSRAAISSIKNKIRLKSSLHFPDGRDSPFKTLNQLTWKLSGFDPGDIMSKKDKEEFFRKNHISFDEDEEEMSEGEIIVDFYSNLLDFYARPLEEIDDKEMIIYFNTFYIKKNYSVIDKMSVDFLIYSIKKYNNWKKEHNKKDYIDSIIYVLKNKIDVPVRVLIVDEAQDLSYSQTKLIDLWIKEYDKEFFVISGDDDQAVHEWRGATPEYLIEFDCENLYEHILDVSYRLPKNVAIFCNHILKTITYRKRKFITSHKSFGNIKYHTNVNLFNLNKILEKYYNPDSRTYLLFRTNKLLNEVANYLFRESDIVFGIINSNTQRWSLKFISISNALNKLQQGKNLTKTEIMYLFDTLPTRTCLEHGVKTNIENSDRLEYTAKEVLSMTKLWKPQKTLINLEETQQDFNKKIKERILKYINYYGNPKDNEKIIEKNELYRRKLERINKIIGISYIDEQRIEYNVELSTFHRSKGLEADNVFVFLGTSEYFSTIDDSERRCFYVACSRTKQNLIFVNSFSGDKTYLEREFSLIILKFSLIIKSQLDEMREKNYETIEEDIEMMQNKSTL